MKVGNLVMFNMEPELEPITKSIGIVIETYECGSKLNLVLVYWPNGLNKYPIDSKFLKIVS
tara:strand:- start:35 stop:217 length:183 start_codon:yes stop_codon:yes gene_type:complete